MAVMFRGSSGGQVLRTAVIWERGMNTPPGGVRDIPLPCGMGWDGKGGYAERDCEVFLGELSRAAPPSGRCAMRGQIPRRATSFGGWLRFICFGIGMAEIYNAAILPRAGKRRYR